MRNIFIVFISVLYIGCGTQQSKTAQEIIDESIEVSQVDKLKNARVSFDFRDYYYIADRNNGSFSLQRSKKDSIGHVIDILTNDGFARYIDQDLTQVPDSMAVKYSESVNSVHYFSVLPLGLNDAAVKKKKLEDVTIKGQNYHKIEITFDQEGGGVDYEDVFVYWINKENYHIDYIAYLFHVNGGGVRFREVSKEQTIEGVRFVNYNNYKPNNPKIDVRKTDAAFIEGELKKVSEINLENIQIEF